MKKIIHVFFLFQVVGANVIDDARQRRIGIIVYYFAINVVTNVYVCLLELMEIRNVAPATTTGRPNEEDQNALETYIYIIINNKLA